MIIKTIFKVSLYYLNFKIKLIHFSTYSCDLTYLLAISVSNMLLVFF